jgi:hypothetical protein
VFITIITDGYLSIKYRSNYDWLEKRLVPPVAGAEADTKAPSTVSDLVIPGVIGSQEQLKLIEDDDLKYLAGNEAKLFVPGGAFNKKEIKSN